MTILSSGRGVAPLAITVMILVLCACGQSQPNATVSSTTPAASSADQLYEAAKKEGEVVVNNQDPESEKPAVAAFEKRYPGIKVTYQIGRGTDIARKLIDQASGNVYTHDVFSAGPHDQAAMQQSGLLVPYQSPELSHVRSEFLDSGKVMDPQYVLVYGITVNTKLVSPDREPKSWADLLDPKWKGKMAMQDPRGSGGTMTLLIGISKFQGLGLDYIRKLSQQDVFIGRDTTQLLTDLIRGEHDVLLAASAGTLVTQKAKNPSVPIKQIKPSEGMAMVLLDMSLVKNAPHPNAAKLWMDWRLSQEGQEVLGQEGQAPVRTGVVTAQDETNMDGVKLLYLDQGQDVPQINDFTKQWDSIFFSK